MNYLMNCVSKGLAVHGAKAVLASSSIICFITDQYFRADGRV